MSIVRKVLCVIMLSLVMLVACNQTNEVFDNEGMIVVSEKELEPEVEAFFYEQMQSNIEKVDERIESIQGDDYSYAIIEDAGELSVTEGVDVDLTKLSSTMIFAEVFQMMSTPTLYVGKIVRAEGIYYSYADPTTKLTYHVIIILDALGCCEQGMEFILANGEYPEQESIITITGEFQIYQENEYTYMHLINAEINE